MRRRAGRLCYAGGMVHREFDVNEETDRMLAELARDYEGVMGKALADQCEETNRTSLLAQVDRAQRGFREGRFTAWDDLKRRNSL